MSYRQIGEISQEGCDIIISLTILTIDATISDNGCWEVRLMSFNFALVQDWSVVLLSGNV